MDLWTCGTVDLWTCGTLDLWTCGPVDLWTCGLVTLWASGLVYLWTCVPVNLGAHRGSCMNVQVDMYTHYHTCVRVQMCTCGPVYVKKLTLCCAQYKKFEPFGTLTPALLPKRYHSFQSAKV